MVAKFLFVLFKAIITQYIKKRFKEDKEKLIKDWNKNIDIPFINEKTEAKGIRTVIELTEKWLIK
mgnify:CR=1 FL=1|tara:strand:+ start:4590 stop:4784 length:195 start_codon:yes stop_codon:yes gene_type:complete